MKRTMVVYNTEEEVTTFTVHELSGMYLFSAETFALEVFTEEQIESICEEYAYNMPIGWFKENSGSTWEDLIADMEEDLVDNGDWASYDNHGLGGYMAWVPQDTLVVDNIPKGLLDLWTDYSMAECTEETTKSLNDILDKVETSIYQEWGF